MAVATRLKNETGILADARPLKFRWMKAFPAATGAGWGWGGGGGTAAVPFPVVSPRSCSPRIAWHRAPGP